MLSGAPPQLRCTCMSPANQPEGGTVLPPLPCVVNDQLTSAGRGLPAASVTPPAPPLIVAVYVAADARAAVGLEDGRVRRGVPGDGGGDELGGRVAQLDGRCRSPCAVASASLKKAVTDELTPTPVAPLAGLVAVTAGGVVSGPVVCVVKTTSTQ